jgi:hypothetical protein
MWADHGLLPCRSIVFAFKALVNTVAWNAERRVMNEDGARGARHCQRSIRPSGDDP